MKRIVVLGMIGSLIVASGASAQQQDRKSTDSMVHPMGGPMPRDMMVMMNSMDTRLDSLVGAMNRARGTDRVDAMAAVINEMVSQRKVMRARFHDGMRGDRMIGGHGDGWRGGRPMPGMQRVPDDTAKPK
jgi:hypothetical protein